MEKKLEEVEGGYSIVWPVKGWGLMPHADVLLATDICSPPLQSPQLPLLPPGIVTADRATLRAESLPAKKSLC